MVKWGVLEDEVDESVEQIVEGVEEGRLDLDNKFGWEFAL